MIGIVIAGDVKTLQKVDSWVREAERPQNEIVDKIVLVPPWNSSEGWTGFNVTLLHKSEAGYEVTGIILPADEDREPKMVMRVINDTALLPLVFSGFDLPTWNATTIYAATFLDGSRKVLHSNFNFLEVDNSSKYVFLFRGLKNESISRPILISVKETWFTGKTLLEPSALNIGITGTTTVVGLFLITRGPRPRKKSAIKKSRTIRSRAHHQNIRVC